MKPIAFFLSRAWTLLLLLPVQACISEATDFRPGAHLQVGDSLPEFRITMNDGSLVYPALLQDSCSVIAFFHTRCPDCRRELPVLQRLYEERPYPFRLVLVSRTEGEASIQDYWNRNGLTMPYSAQNDDAVFRLFASETIPRIYIAGKSLRIKAIFTDRPPATYEDLTDALARANPDTAP